MSERYLYPGLPISVMVAAGVAPVTALALLARRRLAVLARAARWLAIASRGTADAAQPLRFRGG